MVESVRYLDFAYPRSLRDALDGALDRSPAAGVCDLCHRICYKTFWFGRASHICASCLSDTVRARPPSRRAPGEGRPTDTLVGPERDSLKRVWAERRSFWDVNLP